MNLGSKFMAAAYQLSRPVSPIAELLNYLTGVIFNRVIAPPEEQIRYSRKHREFQIFKTAPENVSGRLHGKNEIVVRITPFLFWGVFTQQFLPDATGLLAAAVVLLWGAIGIQLIRIFESTTLEYYETPADARLTHFEQDQPEGAEAA